MSKGVYVTGVERGSGKILVVLGLMDALTRNVERVSYFRPISRLKRGRDENLRLIQSRYPVVAGPDDAYGMLAEEARHWVAQGRIDEALQRILARYKAVEEACDFVVCEGTDFARPSGGVEADLNPQLAKDFGIPAILVLSAFGQQIDEVIEQMRLARNAFETARCSLAGLVVNRVPEGRMEEYDEAISRVSWGEEPVFGIPDVPLLAQPTVGDVALHLGASWLWGKKGGAHRDVRDIRVAAMHLPNFLPHLKEGTLIITPGDREDILVAGLLTATSEAYPAIAGLVLTGGLTPSESTRRLVRGLPDKGVPVLQVDLDTYDTAMAVHEVKPTPGPENEKKIAAALGLFERHVDPASILREIEISLPSVVTPRMFEYGLVSRARSDPKHIVLPEGTDERILRATEILRFRGVAKVTLLGDEEQVRRRAEALGVELGDTPIVNPVTSSLREPLAKAYYERRKHKGVIPDMASDLVTDVSMFGTMMVLLDLADGMVSGAAHTTQHTIRPALQVIKTPPGTALVSSVFFMCLPDRVLVFGDCAVNPNPTPEQLADIAIESAATAARFGVEPRVAMLSYSSGESGEGEDVDKVRLATKIARERRPDLLLDGPMQYDAAVDPGVARKKMPGSPVAGRATVYVFPDLNAGNNTYKAVQRSAGAVAVGPVLQGLRKPVNDLSRGCTVPDVVNTVAITVIQAQAQARAPQPPEAGPPGADAHGGGAREGPA